jgi:hypothetical protein
MPIPTERMFDFENFFKDLEVPAPSQVLPEPDYSQWVNLESLADISTVTDSSKSGK